MYTQLFFILSSIWLHQYYYVFGFLLLVFIILIITCAEITIVMSYFQLCAEDYHWWWRSFLTAGCSGLYLFAYSVSQSLTTGPEKLPCHPCPPRFNHVLGPPDATQIVYMLTKMVMTRGVSILLYIGYMAIASYSFFILTGTVGFFASWFFVRSIYGAVKVE